MSCVDRTAANLSASSLLLWSFQRLEVTIDGGEHWSNYLRFEGSVGLHWYLYLISKLDVGRPERVSAQDCPSTIARMQRITPAVGLDKACRSANGIREGQSTFLRKENCSGSKAVEYKRAAIVREQAETWFPQLWAYATADGGMWWKCRTEGRTDRPSRQKLCVTQGKRANSRVGSFVSHNVGSAVGRCIAAAQMSRYRDVAGMSQLTGGGDTGMVLAGNAGQGKKYWMEWNAETIGDLVDNGGKAARHLEDQAPKRDPWEVQGADSDRSTGLSRGDAKMTTGGGSCCEEMENGEDDGAGSTFLSSEEERDTHGWRRKGNLGGRASDATEQKVWNYVDSKGINSKVEIFANGQQSEPLQKKNAMPSKRPIGARIADEVMRVDYLLVGSCRQRERNGEYQANESDYNGKRRCASSTIQCFKRKTSDHDFRPANKYSCFFPSPTHFSLPKLLRVAPHSDRLVPDCPSLSSSVLVGSSPNLQNWRAARASFQASKDRNRNSIGQGRLPGAEVAAVIASLCSSGTLREELLTNTVLRTDGVSEFDFQSRDECVVLVIYWCCYHLILISCLSDHPNPSAPQVGNRYDLCSYIKRMRNLRHSSHRLILFFSLVFFFSMAPALTATTNDPSSPCISQHLSPGYVSLVGPLHAVQLLRAVILVTSAPSSASSSFTPNKSRFQLPRLQADSAVQEHLQGARHDPLHPLAKGGNERGVDLRKPQAKCRCKEADTEAMLYEIRISGRRLLQEEKNRWRFKGLVLRLSIDRHNGSPLISYKADWVAPRRRAVNHSTCSHFDATASFVQSRRLLTLRLAPLTTSSQTIVRIHIVRASPTMALFSVSPYLMTTVHIVSMNWDSPKSATYTDTPAKLRILRPAPASSTHLTNASGHRPRSPRPTPTPTHTKHQNSVPGIWLTLCARLAWLSSLALGLSPSFASIETPDRWEGTSRLNPHPLLELKLRTGVWTRRAPLRMPDAEPARSARRAVFHFSRFPTTVTPHNVKSPRGENFISLVHGEHERDAKCPSNLAA
ncbi:hypothetical protein CCUS01_01946 [Colletotrichum cuscutae]|uniref:Uncharacterized protein n=1 Tax=Colletotrichum cuscutae TaxID=1209917 RepID=A0AAI9U9M7_9PEZI|nr:hypothetical protein CCUS01_01946 [Colletotrichum cuscutae]